MTKIEIIDETVDWYLNNPRSESDKEDMATGCYYFHPTITEAMCGVGRCLDQSNSKVQSIMNDRCDELIDGIITRKPNGHAIDSLLTTLNIKNIDEILQEKYRDHDLDFWKDIQFIHDHKVHWGDKKLTLTGEMSINRLKKKYAES